MTIQNKLSIIKNQFHLEIQEIEPSVYKVINTDKEINIDKLQWALEECILITSFRKRREKMLDGSSTTIASVYYILVEYNIESALKYEDESLKFNDDTTLIAHKPDLGCSETIDTLYEVGVE